MARKVWSVWPEMVTKTRKVWKVQFPKGIATVRTKATAESFADGMRRLDNVFTVQVNGKEKKDVKS